MIRDIIRLLDRSERRQALGLFALIVFAAVMEVAGIVSVVPFLAVMADPSVIESHAKLRAVYEGLGFADTNKFLFAIGCGVLAVLVATNVIRVLCSWAISRFTYMRGHSIARRLLVTYMNRPYSFFLIRNSAEMAQNILSEVNQVVKNLIVTGMQIIARAVVCLFILALLLCVDPILTLSVFAVLGAAYGLIYAAIHRKIHEVGNRRRLAAQARFKVLSEIFSGVKDIKLMHKERAFIERFDGPSIETALTYAQYDMIGITPRYIFETLAFGGIMIVALYLLENNVSMDKVIPIIGLYAFAGQRLMPALQNIFVNAAQIRFGMPSLPGLIRDLGVNAQEAAPLPAAAEKMPFRKMLALRDVCYRYDERDRTVIDRVNLEIAANTSVGFVGGTGAGKSTLIDIITGLLTPEAGVLEIDGAAVTETNVRAWQRNIGYVSQHIVLFDDTVARNIALGLEDREIDQAAVERAAKAAQLHDFIIRELPRGYDTVIGENGVRLSGGQRQRLGLARALYDDPEVLILDEATSALDNVTERALMDAIAAMNRSKTILIIAHRLSTVKSCDNIVLLEGGKVIATGDFETLQRTSREFKTLAQAV